MRTSPRVSCAYKGALECRMSLEGIDESEGVRAGGEPPICILELGYSLEELACENDLHQETSSKTTILSLLRSRQNAILSSHPIVVILNIKKLKILQISSGLFFEGRQRASCTQKLKSWPEEIPQWNRCVIKKSK